ncbi:hypothetical protein [Lactococcus lactis]|uniref:hypothetical protein n=1 Tax=Lactococcus lactis TaxID=1358 RepID=UPI002418B4CA|nr:hypothetical protein [Lactococcus lactis]
MMNKGIEKLFNTQEEEEIKTDRLQINGNILRIDQTTLQLSNLSSISHGLIKVKIPYAFLIIWGVVGLIFIKLYALIGFILLIGLGIYIYYLYQKTINTNSYLYLQLNSGINYTILFEDKEFLEKAKTVIEMSFNKKNQNIKINIKDQTIIGDNNRIDESSVGDNTNINSHNNDSSVKVGNINNSSLNSVQMGNANHINKQSLNWVELKNDLESVIKSIKTDSEVKQASILALDAVKNEDENLFTEVVTNHRQEFVSELFVNLSGAVLGQVINKILGIA